jgi:hypothetical protein
MRMSNIFFLRTVLKAPIVSNALLNSETRHLELGLEHNVVHNNIILPSQLLLISRLLSFNRLYYLHGNCLLVKNTKRSKHAQVRSIPSQNSYICWCRPNTEF